MSLAPVNKAWAQLCCAADWGMVRSTARAVLGIPDYEAYLAHHAARHAGEAALTREAFVEAKLAARFGGGGLRCC